MQFKAGFLKNYLIDAPLPLAVERSMECSILSQQEFPRPILDIGCGEGIFAKNLFDEKIDVGIDPNAKELKRAKDLDMYVELIECYGDQIPKPDESFNTIMSNSVMEHIPGIEAVLKEAYRLLKDRGIMHLTLPTSRFDHYTFTYQLLNKLGLTTLKDNYRKGFNKFWRHYHYYNKEQWAEMFEKHGFKVVRCQEYGSKNTCILNAALSPFSVFPFITKKISNQWFIFPNVRKFTSKILSKFFDSKTIDPEVSENQGGLIYFCLTKEK